MHFSSLALFSLQITALAGESTARLLRRQARNVQPGAGKTFKLDTMYQGKSFLQDWDFFSAPDPTNGKVKYLNEKDAISKGLAFVQGDNTTVLAVDDKTRLSPGQNRDSVRISSKKKFNGGLFVADFFAMPHGCSTWPAYWTLGDNWPNNGEVDVLEGVHDQPTNQYTLHTSAGCTIKKQNPNNQRTNNLTFTGQVVGTQCASKGGDNAGCGIRDTDERSYGKPFNLLAGGAFVHLWDSQGIKIWHFPRNEIPADINAKTPKPDTWPTPAAVFSSETCDMASHFRDHVLTIDTTLCGDLAGPTFTSMGCKGTCDEAVADPNNFRFAKWKINYIAVYQ